MTITPLGDVVLTQAEYDAVINNLVIPWRRVFDSVVAGSSQYLSYIGGFGDNPEDLENWAWLDEPGSRPDDVTLQAAFTTYAIQHRDYELEDARVAKWRAIVENEVTEDIQAIPGWFNWTETQALTWITSNVTPELSGSYPKTLQAITAIVRLLISIRNDIRPGLEGS